MPITHAPVNAKAASTSAVVVRCGCTDAEKTDRDWHGWLGVPCPHPKGVEDLGEIAYWHRNPLKRLAWRAKRILTGRGFP